MIAKLWPLLIGFTIWAVAFVALYAMQALGCTWAWQPSWHRLILVATMLATMAALSGMLVLQLRRAKLAPSTIERAGVTLTATTLPITLVMFAPVTFLSLCN
ncbi:hypothetical protein SAMN05428969_0273 [Devosia sp. YR412]|uniref:hypothetical protein n=1 Tax=Devosia sp. YR412 TaxID=1881030 RepID=UPI0008D6EB45|nr:hypothetical protein [Devosia sp. YR412]SEP64224.1 hypothetical protein SAMN05428969_0273 [Devosia sp. YR412]